ncbi:hypothetical protein [Nostoc sp.]|uniref:hypothetical protein n=1 Tax=Nostoc sp. TaxID=1180 RepID=UPI002FF73F46
MRKTYGSGRWWKLKGFATVSLDDGSIYEAELHWYEISATRNIFSCAKHTGENNVRLLWHNNARLYQY